ncbi:translation initiation factor IF-2-like [Corvus cornix cornix]|uniref:translation initiation factor IF-2-like n=1 Tax=Corvus cornix cornix TaxID=932674 RepID=UPI001950DF27|nr:translation initiation factor IF-2-like [Corvus cornix cornix]
MVAGTGGLAPRAAPAPPTRPPPGVPEAAEAGRRRSRRGRPASRGSRSSHAGCSSPHINSYCSGGRAPSGSSSGSGNDGDPLLGSPILPPAPQPLTCPPGGDPEPLGDRPRRVRPASSVRPAVGVLSPRPVPPAPPPVRSGAGGGAGAAGTERGPRGRDGGGRGRSQVAQPARRGQEIPERRSQSGPACPGTGHRALGSRRRPVLAGQGLSRGTPGTHSPGDEERGLEGL